MFMTVTALFLYRNIAATADFLKKLSINLLISFTIKSINHVAKKNKKQKNHNFPVPKAPSQTASSVRPAAQNQKTLDLMSSRQRKASSDIWEAETSKCLLEKWLKW